MYMIGVPIRPTWTPAPRALAAPARPALGQNQTVFDWPTVSLILNSSASIFSFIMASQTSKGSTLNYFSWILGFATGFRAINDLSKIVRFR